MTPDNRSLLLDRLPSRIPGLDTILGGGFFNYGVYIIQGHPGSGKTIFGNQLCYGHVKAGGRAVYVTLLAESHTRMLQHLRSLEFFDESVVGDQFAYISAFNDLESEGLKGLMQVLNREMRARHTDVLILDGLVAAAESATTDRELKKFIHDVQTSAVFNACTVFLLTSGSLQRVNPEHTMVDGLIELEDRLFDVRSERSIQVRKFRGDNALRGKHAFQITHAGLNVYPRIETLFKDPPSSPRSDQPLSTGVNALDALIEVGGLPAESATVLIGSTGTGKTTLGLHFLAESTPANPGVFFGFFESPDRLKLRGKSLGLPLAELEASGAIRLIWQPHGEHVLDELAHVLLDEVASLKAKRLVIDGLSGFFEAATFTERIGRFLACVINELRRRGVTVLLTLETRDAVGSVVPTPYGISAMVDNLFFLRYAEAQGEVKRLISILKVRSSGFDPGIHALAISADGLTVEGRFATRGDVIPIAKPLDDRKDFRGPDSEAVER